MTFRPPRRVLIVGSGLAGLRCAEALRDEGYDGSLTLLGDEHEAPYDRPPLSKSFLTGQLGGESLAYRTPEQLSALGVELRLGERAERLHAAEMSVQTDHGLIDFDCLVIATGSRARRLEHLPQLDGIFHLRSLDDGRALRAALASASRLVVAGAGLIGCEVAARARSLGIQVTVVELAPAPMQRALGPEVGRACADLHVQEGTRLLCGVGVAAVGGGRALRSVRLTDGTELPADALLVAVGAEPNTHWLSGSPLALGDGVICDATLSAGGSSVFAAGDVARWTDESGLSTRSEHWTNAVEQARLVARNILSAPAERRPHVGSGFIWSEQYGHQLQVLGFTQDATRSAVVWGAFEDCRAVVLYWRGDRIVGAFVLNAAALLVRCRALIGRQCSLASAQRELNRRESVSLA